MQESTYVQQAIPQPDGAARLTTGSSSLRLSGTNSYFGSDTPMPKESVTRLVLTLTIAVVLLFATLSIISALLGLLSSMPRWLL